MTTNVTARPRCSPRSTRWTFHFTPTSCSWLNAVEGLFAKLTRRRLKNGVFHSVGDLQAAINRFIREYNADSPKPFIWKANPDDIIAARNRAFQTLESIHELALSLFSGLTGATCSSDCPPAAP